MWWFSVLRFMFGVKLKVIGMFIWCSVVIEVGMFLVFLIVLMWVSSGVIGLELLVLIVVLFRLLV